MFADDAPLDPILVLEETDRRKYIGGSDAAAIMGLSDRRTPYSVYLAKTSDEREEMNPDTRKFLDRRKRWEPVVVRMLEEEFDAEIVSVNRRLYRASAPHFAAEIDFEWRDSDGSIQNGEIKTVTPFKFGERWGWGDVGTGDVPIDYEAQVMHGLGITGRRVCVLAAMVGLDDMLFYRIERDEDTITRMRDLLTKFWVENVLAKKAPDPQTLEDIHRMYRKAPVPPLELPADHELASKALHLRGIRSQIGALELQAEAYEFDVKRALGEAKADTLIVDGSKLVTWREQNWTRLDQALLKEQFRDAHRACTKSGKHRVFKTLSSA